VTISRRWLLTILIVAIAPRNSLAQADRISSEEREALVAFYHDVGGPEWIHRDGWLGPQGSECHWYGVQCGKEWKGPFAGNLSVQILELPNNGLVGRIPPDLSALNGLRRLILRGNRIDAFIPDALLHRFDDGNLEIEPLSLVHDIDELTYDFSNPSMLCSGYSAKLTADGRVRVERRMCRESNRQPPELTCEHRDGKTDDFDMLARFLIRGRIFSEPKDFDKFDGSDLNQFTLTAKHRSGLPVNRTWNGATSLSDWGLAVMMDGIIERTHWSASPTKGPCSLPVARASGISP
jgi:hypothetical protein